MCQVHISRVYKTYARLQNFNCKSQAIPVIEKGKGPIFGIETRAAENEFRRKRAILREHAKNDAGFCLKTKYPNKNLTRETEIGRRKRETSLTVFDYE